MKICFINLSDFVVHDDASLTCKQIVLPKNVLNSRNPGFYVISNSVVFLTTTFKRQEMQFETVPFFIFSRPSMPADPPRSLAFCTRSHLLQPPPAPPWGSPGSTPGKRSSQANLPARKNRQDQRCGTDLEICSIESIQESEELHWPPSARYLENLELGLPEELVSLLIHIRERHKWSQHQIQSIVRVHRPRSLQSS